MQQIWFCSLHHNLGIFTDLYYFFDEDICFESVICHSFYFNFKPSMHWNLTCWTLMINNDRWHASLVNLQLLLENGNICFSKHNISSAGIPLVDPSFSGYSSSLPALCHLWNKWAPESFIIEWFYSGLAQVRYVQSKMQVKVTFLAFLGFGMLALFGPALFANVLSAIDVKLKKRHAS